MQHMQLTKQSATLHRLFQMSDMRERNSASAPFIAGTIFLALILSASDLRACTASVSTSLSGSVLTVTISQGGSCYYNGLQRSGAL